MTDQTFEQLTDSMIKLAIGLIIIAFFLMIVVTVGSTYYIKENNKEICKQLDMIILTDSSGGFFQSAELTCWNPETKQVIKVK